ncbi:MAG TPA: OadG family protein [Bacteroidales bacterium]|nr:OadG family protein [Bacteroidales bacterium]HRZ48010.1 OadG family protein [Bacteroidales bacterium]
MSNIGNENIIISVVGYVIVFVALFILVGIFLSIPKFVQMAALRRMKKKGMEIPKGNPVPVTGEENAAIAMAVHLFLNEIHDDESNVITIKKVSRSYSPWSSKIYGLNGTRRRLW